MQPFTPQYYKDDQLITEKTTAESALNFFYKNRIGKCLRFFLRRKWCSQLMGWYQNSWLTKRNITPFIKKHAINMNDFDRNAHEYKSFNDFFCRKLKPGARLINQNKNVIISPADAKLLVFPQVTTPMKFFVKMLPFNLETFLQSYNKAQEYHEGTMMILRLAPYDYHRYHFPFSCYADKPIPITGTYESVNPIAYGANIQPLTHNIRTIITLRSDVFGDVLMIPVGALFVGSIIHTYTPETNQLKGDEAGYFSFGGSTIVLLFKKGTIEPLEPFVKNSQEGYETAVQMGQAIASKSIKSS